MPDSPDGIDRLTGDSNKPTKSNSGISRGSLRVFTRYLVWLNRSKNCSGRRCCQCRPYILSPMSPGRTPPKMARPEGLEPPTLCFEGRRSIQLSYGRTVQSILPSSTYSYFLENCSFKSRCNRCNRCNNGLFGWIFGKIETKSNGLGLSQAHVNLLEQMRVNL